ncbi:MAG: DEAD/DEAH box helicase, partial [Candidatus Taylorbacteria bacterium]
MNIYANINDHFRITPVQRSALHKLGIHTINDLLHYFPIRYGDTAEAYSIDSLIHGDTAVIYGKLSGLKTSKGFHTKIAMADGYVEDETGRIHCVWFNQPYVAKMYTNGMLVRVEGKISQRRKKEKVPPIPLAGLRGDVTLPERAENRSILGELYFSNPKIEVVDKLPIGVGDSLFGDDNEKHTLYPVYPESRGITSLWMYHAIQKIFKSSVFEQIEDPIPEDILKKYNLPTVKTAMIWIHTPLNKDDALSARKRFSFEEIFTIQLGKQQAKKEYETLPSFAIEANRDNVREFIKRFPFTATNAQNQAITKILDDFNRDHAMSRLLEGDVGSGKTAVAAATAYAVMVSRSGIKKLNPVDTKGLSEGATATEKERAASKRRRDPEEQQGLVLNSADSIKQLQVAYMCPTEILATQHFESFISFFSYMPIQIALITGSVCKKFPSKVNPKGWTDISRAQLLKWVADGSISVVIGTHSLIQKSVVFRNLAYVIIDEQHRFGTSQRAKLVKKAGGEARTHGSPIPHLLSMTATPIPRTLALTMYGDLDLTLLDESPAGRKPIITELVLPTDRTSTYEKIGLELKTGRQMYVICPRIDEPDPDKEAAVIAKSVKEEARRLKQK